MFKINKKRIIAGALAAMLSVVTSFTGVISVSAAGREALFPYIEDNLYDEISTNNYEYTYAGNNFDKISGVADAFTRITSMADLVQKYKIVVGHEDYGYTYYFQYDYKEVNIDGDSTTLVYADFEDFHDVGIYHYTYEEAVNKAQLMTEEVDGILIPLNPLGLTDKNKYKEFIFKYNFYFLDGSNNLIYTIPLPELLYYSGNSDAKLVNGVNATADTQVAQDAQTAQSALDAQAAQLQAQATAEEQAVAAQQTVTNVAQGTYTVEAGDNLCKIAQKVYGDMKAWRTIYNANSSVVKSDYIIYKGQVLIIPAR